MPLIPSEIENLLETFLSSDTTNLFLNHPAVMKLVAYFIRFLLTENYQSHFLEKRRFRKVETTTTHWNLTRCTTL